MSGGYTKGISRCYESHLLPQKPDEYVKMCVTKNRFGICGLRTLLVCVSGEIMRIECL